LITLLVLASLLSQTPPPECGVTMSCALGGFLSRAGYYHGSGTPDFTCGSPDDGTAEHSKYCLFISRTNSLYRATHGDFTFKGDQPRQAGTLFQIMNSLYGSQTMFSVNWKGDLFSYGKGLEVQQNGAGVSNRYSYVGLKGSSTNKALIADVYVAPITPHRDGGYVLDVANGAEQVLRVRDDGALKIAGKVYRLDVVETETGPTLKVSHEQTDGGVVDFLVSTQGAIQ
jgi:hypothetical protein